MFLFLPSSDISPGGRQTGMMLSLDENVKFLSTLVKFVNEGLVRQIAHNLNTLVTQYKKDIFGQTWSKTCEKERYIVKRYLIENWPVKMEESHVESVRLCQHVSGEGTLSIQYLHLSEQEHCIVEYQIRCSLSIYLGKNIEELRNICYDQVRDVSRVKTVVITWLSAHDQSLFDYSINEQDM